MSKATVKMNRLPSSVWKRIHFYSHEKNSTIKSTIFDKSYACFPCFFHKKLFRIKLKWLNALLRQTKFKMMINLRWCIFQTVGASKRKIKKLECIVGVVAWRGHKKVGKYDKDSDIQILSLNFWLSHYI